MARPLRLEFPGALYHITSRGDRRQTIYRDDRDRQDFIDLLGNVCERYAWRIHAYCLMGNHYHLLAETREANLSQGMRQLNGVFTQRCNHRHERVGHLFQGRYKAILVQKEAYLLELVRYILLNPVRAELVADPAQWAWSSYPALLGRQPCPAWLDLESVLSHFGKDRLAARAALQRFILRGIGQAGPWGQLQHQVMLGDEAFLRRHQSEPPQQDIREIPRQQRRLLVKPLHHYQQAFDDPKQAMAQAYRSGGYTMKEVADHFGVHYVTVSRAVRKFEE